MLKAVSATRPWFTCGSRAPPAACVAIRFIKGVKDLSCCPPSGGFDLPNYQIAHLPNLPGYRTPTCPFTESISFFESQPTPSLNTSSTFSMSAIFADGSPFTSMMSACLPGVSEPI